MQENKFNATTYILKILGGITLFTVTIGFILFWVFAPVKAENKIKSGLSKINISYSKIECFSGFNIDCKIYNFNSPITTGSTTVEELTLFDVQQLHGFSTPKFTGTISLKAQGKGLSLIEGQKSNGTPLVENLFNGSNIDLGLKISYVRGVASSLDIHNINLSLPNNNGSIHFSSEILDVNTKPYFTHINTGFEFDSIQNFIYSSYAASNVGKSKIEIKENNLKYFNKKTITKEDSFASFQNDMKKLQEGNRYPAFDPLYEALKDPDLKSFSVNILNPGKKDFEYLSAGLMYGALLKDDLEFIVETH